MHYQHPAYRNTPNSDCRDAEPVIKVSGEGSVAAKPDRASIVLGAVTEDQELTRAQSENSGKISAIIESLLEIGISRENIQTFEYRAEPQYDYQDGKQLFRGYRVTHLLRITVENISQTGSVVDKAVQSGANTVNSIEFSIAEPQKYYNKALAAAVQNSAAKAAAIARTLGVTLIKTPRKVTEETRAPGPVPFQTFGLAKSEGAVPIETGKLTIQATVRAQYAFY